MMPPAPTICTVIGFADGPSQTIFTTPPTTRQTAPACATPETISSPARQHRKCTRQTIASTAAVDRPRSACRASRARSVCRAGPQLRTPRSSSIGSGVIAAPARVRRRTPAARPVCAGARGRGRVPRRRSGMRRARPGRPTRTRPGARLAVATRSRSRAPRVATAPAWRPRAPQPSAAARASDGGVRGAGAAGAGRAREPPSRRRARTVPLHVALAALLPPGGRALGRAPRTFLPARRAATESMLACLAGAHFTLHRSISTPARCVTSSVGARAQMPMPLGGAGTSLARRGRRVFRTGRVLAACGHVTLDLRGGACQRGAVRHRAIAGRSHAPGHRHPLRAPRSRLAAPRRGARLRAQAPLRSVAGQLLAAQLRRDLPGARPSRRRRADRARPGRTRVEPQALPDHGEGTPQPRRLHSPAAHRCAPAAAPGARGEAALRPTGTPAGVAPADRSPARSLHAPAEPARSPSPAARAQLGRLLRDAAPHRRGRAQRALGARLARRGHAEAAGALRGRDMIEFRQVSKVFGSGETAVRAVDDLSFHCPPGGFWALTGPSGSGKSTVLHLIAGLTPPTSGRVLVDGADVAGMSAAESAALRRRRIGYVLQAFNLLPFLTARENVGMPLVLDGVRQAEVDARVDRALAQVSLRHRAGHLPTHLSGGEQERLAIARALVIRPAIILADEPTGNLDRAAGRQLMDLIGEINESTGVTVLLVTHDPVFAAYAHRVLRLVDGALRQDMALVDAHRDPARALAR